jgi:hypothetical protein
MKQTVRCLICGKDGAPAGHRFSGGRFGILQRCSCCNSSGTGPGTHPAEAAPCVEWAEKRQAERSKS